MRERSLVFFTLSAQTSAGAYMILAVFQLFGPDELLTLPVIAILGVLLGLGLIAAFFHLGSPGRVFRVLSNLRSSWLSREILAVSVFGCLLLIQVMLLLSGIQLTCLLAAVTTVSALALVIVMGRAYMLSVVPIWNTPLTILSFFASSILLGGGLVLLLSNNIFPDGFSQYVLPVIVLTEIAVLFEISAGVWRYRVRSWSSSKAIRRVGDIHQQGDVTSWLGYLHLGLLLLFGVILAISKANIMLIGLAFALALIGQVAGRVLFYQVGLGQESESGSASLG